MLVDLKAPNGLAISPDESTLYLTQSRNRRIWAYNLMPNGSINRASERILFELPESYPAGVFDGMKVDIEGEPLHHHGRRHSHYELRRQTPGQHPG